MLRPFRPLRFPPHLVAFISPSGIPRLTKIRVRAPRVRTGRVILVRLPVSGSILKSSSCLTERLILIHTEKARPDHSRPLFPGFRPQITRTAIISRDMFSDWDGCFGDLEIEIRHSRYGGMSLIDWNFYSNFPVKTLRV